MKYRRRLFVFLILLAITGTAVYLASETYLFSTETNYEYALVERGDIELTIAATGKVKPKHMVEVGAQVTGQLKQLLVDVGDYVVEGDLLAEIDPTLAQARVDQSLAQLKELDSLKMQQEARIDLAIVEASRFELLNISSAISKVDYEISLANLKIAQAELAKLEAQIEGQQSVLNADFASLEYTKIYAPISGTIVEIPVVEGQTLNSSQTAPTILRIADMSQITVVGEISEADVLHIEPGQTARFKILGSDREWDTEVAKILPEPDVVNDVVLYKAHLDVTNHDNALLSEMTAQVFFILDQTTNALTIPVAALAENRRFSDRLANRGAGVQRQARGNQGETRGIGERDSEFRKALEMFPEASVATVYLEVADDIEPTRILIGTKNRSSAEVLYGLQDGDRILLGMEESELPVRQQNNSLVQRDRRLRPQPGI